MGDIVDQLREGCEFGPDYPLDPESFLCHRIECRAADEIERLRAEITRLREERRWIPVGERLPGDNVAVLVNHECAGVEMAYLKDGLWCISWTGFKHSGVAYTHWMPLPAPPNGGEVE